MCVACIAPATSGRYSRQRHHSVAGTTDRKIRDTHLNPRLDAALCAKYQINLATVVLGGP